MESKGLIKYISSSSNTHYKELVELKKKAEKASFVLLEGEDLVNLAYKNHNLIEVISTSEQMDYSDIHQCILPAGLIRELSSYKSLPSVMGVSKFSYASKLDGDIIYLDGVQDPGNLGTIMRTALAFGYKSLALSYDCVSPMNFKAIQASKGSFMELKIKKCSLEEIKNQGYSIVVTSLDGKNLKEINRPEGKICLVFGNEGQGVKKVNQEMADYKVFIEMDRVIDSLNVGVSAGILMYLWKR